MKVAVVIICDDHIYQSALKKCMASIRYFHPEFKIVHYNTEKINQVKYELQCDDIRYIAPYACVKTWNEEQPDVLIKMGADCLVLGDLTDALKDDYDVACARNDSDFIGTRNERMNRPDLLRELPNNLYVNADFVITKSGKFLAEWHNLTYNCYNNLFLCQKEFEKIFNGDDQQTLNLVFHLGKYKRRILDPEGGDVCYGSSSSWAGEVNFVNDIPDSIKGKQVNCWPAWKRLTLDKNLNTILPDLRPGFKDRIVKVLHQGGGTWEPKLSFDLFNPEYRKYLKQITGFDE
jgi:hypothetical protein